MTTIPSNISKQSTEILLRIILYSMLVALCLFGSPASIILLVVVAIVDIKTRGGAS